MINIDFFKNITILLIKKNIIPDYHIDKITELPNLLKKHFVNKKGIILDIDQTIVPYSSSILSKEILETIELISKEYKCCLVSNSHRSVTNNKRMKTLEKLTHLKVIKQVKKKPDPIIFIQAIKFLGTDFSETIMVGDRIFTDIVGANNLCITSILVEPIDVSTDPILIRLIRLFETFIYKIIT